MGLFDKIFGTYSDRAIKQVKPIVNEINALEPEMEKKSDAELRAMTGIFKERLAKGEDLDDILPEAFAVVREAAKRVLGQRHYDVQLLGGIVLHQGRIAEMKTGEGKTLVSTLPAYLNALTGKGVHLVTVNDYLAKRDSEWMGKIYSFLGLTVGCIVHDLTADERRAAYNCDITYATNNELGFDYLRDNMVIYKQQLVQRDLNFAIVDEVDSILIDEARTPLIISGAGNKSSELYERADAFVSGLKALVIKETDSKDLMEDVTEDYIVDEKARTATLTTIGVGKAERFFTLENLSDPENAEISHHINQALKAHGVMKRDIDYVVKDDQIIIVDEFTGRLMFGRRYNEGLHQAIEAKERVKIQKESMTQATITFQNFFRMYKKLSGMTGTAQTEEQEFNDIYSLDVIVVPTNKPVIRIDYPDSVYKTVAGKYKALLKDVVEVHEKGQPILIGTVSIEKSEHLSKLLGRNGIKHNVLNAKNHEREAEIIAQAGKFGTVTIATNMAGRGTDIVLGGNSEYMAKQDLRREGYTEEQIAQADSYADTSDENVLKLREHYRELVAEHDVDTKADREKVVAAGGLFIMGTERHESRRIDNQLRGRSGRQGDPGMSRFYIALEDDLMRLFGSERMMSMIDALGVSEDYAIENKLLSNAIETAQKRVEGRNFDSRKNVLQYDDVMNQQREIIYAQRRKVLDGENLKESFHGMIRSRISDTVDLYCNKDVDPEYWNLDSVEADLVGIASPAIIEKYRAAGHHTKPDEMAKELIDDAILRYDAKEVELGEEIMREAERVILLRSVDENWMTHIDAVDQMKYGVGLLAYGQKSPIVEYKFQAFQMFEDMNKTIQDEAVRRMFSVQLRPNVKLERKSVAGPGRAGFEGEAQRSRAAKHIAAAKSAEQRMAEAGGEGDGHPANPGKPVTYVRKTAKVGRNDPCPCGSGKKYKDCCGADE
ncbi:MAG: preprotein translocase subunit SecA [Clostridia bacterium]|nr:preprotein translocase subunit SecA [Clostridia bacterium]